MGRIRIVEVPAIRLVPVRENVRRPVVVDHQARAKQEVIKIDSFS